MWLMTLLATGVSVPDIGDIGRSAAQLGDPLVIALYFSMALNLVLVVLWQVANLSNRKTADRFADAATKTAEATLRSAEVGRSENAQVAVQLALHERHLSEVEKSIAQIAAKLEVRS